MEETYDCIFCEDGEAPLDEEEYGDPNYDEEAYCNWQRYGPCPNCGAYFTLGTKSIEFSHINEEGDPEKAVYAGCFNCYYSWHSPQYDALGCDCCIRGEIIGTKNPDCKNNWRPLTKTQLRQES